MLKKVLITATLATLSLNATEKHFGAELFNEGFVESSAQQFSPTYIINIGDKIQLALYGAVNHTESYTVDPNGNIYSAHFPPIKVAGTQYQNLNDTITKALSKRFKNNVKSYAYLENATPVKVMVTGYVTTPGMYYGVNSDNPLTFLNKAGGIDQTKGTIQNVIHYRNGEKVTSYNLQKMFTVGTLNTIQFHQNDSLYVPQKAEFVTVEGDSKFNGVADFNVSVDRGASVIKIANPLPSVSHVRVTTVEDGESNTSLYTLKEFSSQKVNSGDVIDFISEIKKKYVAVRLLGEHESHKEHSVTKGQSLKDFLTSILLNDYSSDSIQLYRRSVKDKQKARLESSLNQLERSVLTTMSDTESTALLRKSEAELVSRWIESARQVEPKGQVVIPTNADLSKIILEDGDVIHIPSEDNLIQVNGEVIFPVAIAYEKGKRANYYIDKTGGLTNEDARVMIVKRTGEVRIANDDSKVKLGDEILVLPELDEKEFQFAKDMTQILYQVAASAAIIIGV